MQMSHSMTEPKEVLIMMIIMFIAGLFSSMNNWVDKISDVQFHLNDVYMSFLMCGWSLILMGIYYIHLPILMIGIVFTGIILYCIRTQLFINETQYVKGMIPHHSMAVLMSKKLLEKDKQKEKETIKNKHSQSRLIPTLKRLAHSIIDSQNDEINVMKSALYYKHIM